MPQVPPLPARKESLPNRSPRTPPVPNLPSKTIKRGIHSSHRVRPHSEHFHCHTCPRKSSSVRKMAALQDSASLHLNLDSSGSYQFEARNFLKDSFRTLHGFYENQEMCDVEIRVGNKSFKCHRVVLACASLYFRAMFKSEMAETKQEVITIQDLDEDAMEKVVNFAYTARIKITTETVQQILFAASILQIESVAEACANFMKLHLHPSNCIEVNSLHIYLAFFWVKFNYFFHYFLQVCMYVCH